MAVEVYARNYLFSKATKVAADYIGEKTSSEYSFCQSQQDEELPKQFWANYIHDLESIWWIVVWTYFLFKKDTEEGTPTTKSELTFENLFQSSKVSDCRYNFLSHPEIFEVNMKKVTYGIPELAKIVLKIRRKLLAAYALEEIGMDKTLPILMKSDCKIHEEIHQILESTRTTSEDHNVVLASGKSVEKQISIWELGPTPRDDSVMGDETLVEVEARVKNTKVTNENTESISPCKNKNMRKSRVKRKLQEVNASSPISEKKGRIADLEGNMRVTRSMTKHMLKESASSGEDRKNILKNCRKNKKTRRN